MTSVATPNDAVLNKNPFSVVLNDLSAARPKLPQEVRSGGYIRLPGDKNGQVHPLNKAETIRTTSADTNGNVSGNKDKARANGSSVSVSSKNSVALKYRPETTMELLISTKHRRKRKSYSTDYKTSTDNSSDDKRTLKL